MVHWEGFHFVFGRVSDEVTRFPAPTAQYDDLLACHSALAILASALRGLQLTLAYVEFHHVGNQCLSPGNCYMWASVSHISAIIPSAEDLTHWHTQVLPFSRGRRYMPLALGFFGLAWSYCRTTSLNLSE